MSGIYIHIPFCKQACHYCNFHFSTSLAFKEEMIACMVKEIELREKSVAPAERVLCGEQIQTIYFGGGTPSLLTSAELERILKAIFEGFSVSEHAEITLEANPDDISPEKVQQWKALGVNRLSIGIQSFIERDLLWMNRAHNAEQAINSISIAQKSGIDNISIDLIFGTPGLNNREWRNNINTAVNTGVPHIAAYALTVEPKTALYKMIELKKKENVNADEQANQFKILMNQLESSGFEHYEISNFAKPGYRSRHNSSYWQGKKYMGIGPSAHSYDGKSRMWNLANNALYMRSLKQNIIPLEVENLTDTQRLNEYLMISLRTSEGMDLAYLEQYFSPETRKAIEKNSLVDLQEGNLKQQGNRLVLTQKGKLLADAISVRMFVLD